MGIQNNQKIRAVPAYPGRVVPLENFMARKFSIGFLGGYILVQGCFGVSFEALGICLADFCPRSIIPVPSIQIRSTPLRAPTTQLTVITS